jgi:phage shock protein A
MAAPIHPELKQKSFWKRPEGVTGLLFLIGIIAGGGYLLATNINWIIGLVSNTITLVALLAVLAAIIYIILDPRARTLIWYMYKSIMRKITGVFVTLDPIGILKNYVEDLEDKLRKMSKQIGAIRGQMRKLKMIIEENVSEISKNMKMASQAKAQGKDQQMVLASRKAARLTDSNEKYQALLNKMEIMYRILTRMYQNSEILLEDTRDQVNVKEQERKTIRASHSAMKSAMSIISGDPDKRAMFDAAMEAITEDVANKVGEMERFMELSANFMDSVDLQNGIFEEEGLKMLEEWEKKSTLMLLGDGNHKGGILDLQDDVPVREKKPQKRKQDDNPYGEIFD